jgi:ribosomal protein S11
MEGKNGGCEFHLTRGAWGAFAYQQRSPTYNLKAEQKGQASYMEIVKDIKPQRPEAQKSMVERKGLKAQHKDDHTLSAGP